ncbi:MAG: hypothetical protein MJ133_02810 [Lachnospiraceae bacterium]|nr:hypothetical protein [Lachnospiraceae bacterium]
MKKKSQNHSVLYKIRQPKNRISLIVLLLGMMAALYVWISENQVELLKGNEIIRNEYGDGDYERELTAIYGDEKEKINILVTERKYSKEELEDIFSEFMKNIHNRIKGENTSLEEVRDNLQLLNKYDGYPFSTYWNTSDETVIDRKGRLLCPTLCDKYHDIELKGTVIYMDYKDSFSVFVHVVPRALEPGEKKKILLEELVKKSNEDNINEKSFQLPNSVENEPIEWETNISQTGLWIVLIMAVLIPLLRLAYDYDRKKEKEKRKSSLENEYPLFVTKLKLFMCAGLNIKNSLVAIQKDMREMKAERNSMLLNELDYTINMVKNGTDEEHAIEEFGRRCQGLYRKLAFLLSVNLKRGNDKIRQLLEEECHTAYAVRKERAMKKADEAAVKLLFPMMLMLLMIMIIIMLPAYYDFGGN